MKRSALILLLVCLFLSGCTAKYDLNISDDIFDENVHVEFKEKEFSIEELSTMSHIINGETNAFYGEDGNEIINKELTKKGNKQVFNMNYRYTSDNFDNAYVINNCFDGHVFLEDENHYYLAALGDFYCNYNGDVDISISTDYIVLDTNAKYKNGKYVWTIKHNDNKDLDLYIDILKEKQERREIQPYKIIGLSIMSLLTLIAYLLHRRIEKNRD